MSREVQKKQSFLVKSHLLFGCACRKRFFKNFKFWNPDLYKKQYADSKLAQLSPKLHFLLNSGDVEGIKGLEGFDVDFVANHYSVDKSFAVWRYIKLGYLKGWHTVVPRVFPLSESTNDYLCSSQKKGKKSHALALHLFHYDLWEEMVGHITGVEDLVDLYINVTEQVDSDATLRMVKTIKKVFPDAVVLTFPNHGRDILPFMQVVKTGQFAGYSTVTKIHTKRSHPKIKWRERLIGAILGDRNLYLEALRKMKDEKVGLIGSSIDMYTGETYWKHNIEGVKEMCDELGFDKSIVTEDLAFLGGSIFVIEGNVLDSLRNLSVEQVDWPVEAGQLDGTKGHQIERMFSIATVLAGLKIEGASPRE